MTRFGRYLAVALFLALLLGGTYALRVGHLARIEERGTEVQNEAVAHARQLVVDELESLQADLLRRAERVAALEPVRRLLRGDTTARAEVIEHFATLRLPEGYTAELYTPTPDLVAWQGPSLPLDPATRTTRFLSLTQTAVVSDAALREAVVVWRPIRDEGRVLGAVRTLRIVRAEVPVRNQYLRDFDLVEQWQRRAGIPITVRFEPPLSGDSTAHLVRGLDGTVLAEVEVPTPPIALLHDETRRAYDDVLAFWAVLLLGWGLFGMALLVQEVMRRAILGRTQGAWLTACAVLVGASAVWIGVRYGLLALRIPARWFGDMDTPLGESQGLAALFDPVYIASNVGGGLLGSAGELAVTAVFVVVLGLAWCWFGVLVARYARSEAWSLETSRYSQIWWLLRASLGVILALAAVGGMALLVRRATLDATLPYFDRTGPLPEPLVMLTFGALLLVVMGTLSLLVGLALLARTRGWGQFLGSLVASVLGLALVYAFTSLSDGLPWWVAAALFGVAGWVAWEIERGPDVWAWPLTLRGMLVTVLVVAGLTYPIIFQAVQDKRTAQIVDVADEFADGEDSRVAFAIEGVLLDARASNAVLDAFTAFTERALVPDSLRPAQPFDSLATDLVTGSLLVSLADYTVGLTLLSASNDSLGSYQETPPPGADPVLFGMLATEPNDPLGLAALRRQYTVGATPGFLVKREATEEEAGKFRYAGLGPIRRAGDGAIIGWVMARAEPKPARYASETPFPRVLVPAGLPSLVESDLALGEFRDGVLVRSRGDDFGRFRLPEEVEATLRDRDTVWKRTRIEGRKARVLYQRLDTDGRRVVAVREAEIVFFDQLYFFLRLLLPGLVIGFVAYGLGLKVRQQAGVFSRRSRLRDRVLNRFLAVGVVSVALTGLVGQAVIVEQNQQAVQDRLKRRLARIEVALYAEVNPGGIGTVPLFRVLDRARPDVVGPREGLDVNLYRGADLIASSRSQLVRQQLIDRRLPIAVYEKLFVEGERYAFAEEQIGTFTYTTGYEVLPDDDGQPGAVIAIPTLPEQIAIEADQSRMIAYLFGVLLLLLVGIFFITSLLANRLTQPFRRLRQGLLAVGAGETISEPIPVESEDEVGELIETFNAMHSQLEASRRKLAQQERELAWREMARQVAHEIKNPLTPMKLSVQHLRRAHAKDAGPESGKFGALLDRITGTLIEQIDALTRIANEFSNFARLPDRHLENLDLNAVIREAAALSGEEEHAALVLALAEEPLPVRADREELRRVYINLFKNALQALPEGKRGTITVLTEHRSKGPKDALAPARTWAWSAVNDNGSGIPEDVRDKVFQPNFSTKTSGMGLGLAISKKAIEDMRGVIGFETEIGLGTTFFVWLPTEEVAEEENDVDESLRPLSGSA